MDLISAQFPRRQSSHHGRGRASDVAWCRTVDRPRIPRRRPAASPGV